MRYSRSTKGVSESESRSEGMTGKKSKELVTGLLRTFDRVRSTRRINKTRVKLALPSFF